MAELQRFPLTTTTGQRGYILRRARFLDPSEQSRVILEDGTELVAPSDAVEPQNDGSFLLHTKPPRRTPAVPDTAETLPPEPLEEVEPVSTAARTEPVSRNGDVPTARRTDMPPTQFTSQVTDALYEDEVGIDRVAVNQIVDEPPTTRQEGDITIIPVVEEVLVVRKRYMVKEEIRINRSRHQVQEPRRILVDELPAANRS